MPLDERPPTPRLDDLHRRQSGRLQRRMAAEAVPAFEHEIIVRELAHALARIDRLEHVAGLKEGED